MARILVIYFSQSGRTAWRAQALARWLKADSYQIQAANPYTAGDLDYNDPSSRVNQEMNDASARPAYKGTLPDIQGYEVILVGFPLWWGICPRVVTTVLEDLDLSGKQVAGFATSGGSGFSAAQAYLEEVLGRPLPAGLVVETGDQFRQWAQQWEEGGAS